MKLRGMDNQLSWQLSPVLVPPKATDTARGQCAGTTGCLPVTTRPGDSLFSCLGGEQQVERSGGPSHQCESQLVLFCATRYKFLGVLHACDLGRTNCHCRTETGMVSGRGHRSQLISSPILLLAGCFRFEGEGIIFRMPPSFHPVPGMVNCYSLPSR